MGHFATHIYVRSHTGFAQIHLITLLLLTRVSPVILHQRESVLPTRCSRCVSRCAEYDKQAGMHVAPCELSHCFHCYVVYDYRQWNINRANNITREIGRVNQHN
jgi:hypothetical protein